MNINRSLFALLLGDTGRMQRAIVTISNMEGWDEAICLAEAWKVLPRLAKIIQEQGLQLSPASAATLRTKVITYALRSSYVARRAGELAQVLEHKAIDAVAFKGVATLARLHRTPAARMLGDIDLIVREKDLDAALQAIQSAGFKIDLPIFGKAVTAQHQCMEQLINKDNYTVRLVDDEKLEVDLHYRMHGRIAALVDAGIWERAEVLPLLGRHVRVVSPVDAIVLAVHHSCRNQFFPFPTVRDLGDLADYWHGTPDTWEIPALAMAAKQCALGGSLLALCGVLEQIGNITAQDTRLTALRQALSAADGIEAEQLGRWFFDRLDDPSLNRQQLSDLFKLVSNPMSLVHVVWDRLVARHLSAGLSWRRKLNESEAPPRASDAYRSGILVYKLLTMNWRQWRGLWRVARVQRSVFAPKHHF